MKYVIPLLFMSGIAFAQAPQPSQPQPAQTPPQVAQPPLSPTPNAANITARNHAIDQIEQALQHLKTHNQ